MVEIFHRSDDVHVPYDAEHLSELDLYKVRNGTNVFGLCMMFGNSIGACHTSDLFQIILWFLNTGIVV